MPGEITIQLTDRECEVLAELSDELDLPQDRVMIQALRSYQLLVHRCETDEQRKCDHEWEVIDESFDHEYGTEQIAFERCKLCDEERDYQPERFDDDVI